jgi:hypothetical protein
VRALLLALCLPLGCSHDVLVGMNDPGAAGAGAGCVPVTCEGAIYACGDCVDNDGDGRVDADDPECFGACDDTEDSFYDGTVGPSAAACKQDCYFDRDTGSGNDGCHFSQKCDPLSADAQCAYDPSTTIPGTSSSCADLESEQTPDCLSVCLPLVPAGCDCFGCCEIPAGSGVFVWLGSTVDGVGSCDSESVGDGTRCRPCTPVPSCFRE